MTEKLETRVIQVTNVAPSCAKEQLRTLFSFVGRVKDLQMYPPECLDAAVSARIAYVEFEDSVSTGVALHLSSTVFVDRALMIVPVMDGKIPDELTALTLTPQAVAGLLPGQPTWPSNVVSQMTGTGANQVITTCDPRLTSLGLPQYPPLPASTDANTIDEIRRTVYISDLDPKVTAEMLLNFFSQVGEIKYVRLAGDEHAGARSAYIEFTDQRSVAQALTFTDVVFQGRPMTVQHSKTSIVKPSGKASEVSQREINDAMKKVKEAQKLISAAAAEPKKEPSQSPPRKRSRSKSKPHSRSPSRTHRSRSRSKPRRRRSGSRSRRRSRSRHRSPRRSRSPIRRRRSRSRGRVAPAAPPVRRSRSRERRRSRTRSPIRRRRSRTRSRSRKKSRTPPKSYSKRSRSRSRRRSRSRKRSRSKDRRVKEKKKSISLSPPRLERNGSLGPKGDKDDSPVKRDSSANVEEDSGKASTKKRSPTPVKARRRSPTPRKRSRSKSPSRRIKRRRRTRSPSPRRRSRSRSGSRHKSKRDRSKRSRSRDRDRKHDSKKKSTRDKDEKKKESSSTKVKRDYDEEEKGYASGSEKDRAPSGTQSPSGSPPHLDAADKDSDHQAVDMDMSD